MLDMSKDTLHGLHVLVMAFAIAGAALTARAEYYLWFKVDQSGQQSPVQFDYAQVAYRTSSSEGYSAYLVTPTPYADGNYYTAAWNSLEGWISTDADQSGRLNADDPGSYQFRVELFNESESGEGEMLAFSEAKGFAELQGMGCFGSKDALSQDKVWTVQSFTAVPEPTSGMLFLLGLASLALRRRRV